MYPQTDTPSTRAKSTSSPVSSDMSLHDAMEIVRERLRNKERWPKEHPLTVVLIRHWVADIILALESLHKSSLVIGYVAVLGRKGIGNVCCSDLNWRNVLLDAGGRVVLTHQCVWSCNDAPVPHKMSRLMYAPPG